MKHILKLGLILAFFSIYAVKAQETKAVPEHLTVETFKEKVYNYEKNPDEWVFEGKLPAIVDFYADWCKPCKIIAPIMEELSEEYKGKIVIYKVNTEQQRELSRIFGIRSIPSVLFIPKEGKPQMTQGALPKETFKQVIDEFLLGIKKDQ
ncbi:MAG: thioredoxin [Bacteroidales bacterium]|nr:thioredoxin [Bacteroidales bacterium]